MKLDLSDMFRAIKDTTDSLREAAGESTLRAAAVAGAAVFRDEAKQNALAHRQTGVLHNNIIIKHLPEESDGSRRQVYIVTVRTGKFGADGDAYYWRWVERGHKIIWKKAGQSRNDARKEAARLEYGTARVPAYPFMRPAFDSKKQPATEASKIELARKIKEAWGGP